MPGSANNDAEHGGTDGRLVIGLVTSIQTLDPGEAIDHMTSIAIAQVFETPFEQLDATRAPRPMAFGSHLVLDPDPDRGSSTSTYLGSLREDLRLSDGSSVSPREVADALQGAIGDLGRVRVKREQIAIELERNNPRLEVLLSKRWAMIAVRHGSELLGTGPYAVARHENSDLVLTRNEFHPCKPAIRELVFRTYGAHPQGATNPLVAAVERGEVDFTMSLTRSEIGGIKGVRKLFHPGNSTAILFYNLESDALGDVDTRRALCRAVDRFELARIIYDNPGAFTARCLLPPAMGAFSDGIRPEIEAARAALEGTAATTKPLRMLVIWGSRPYLPTPMKTAEALQRQLRQVGVEIEIEQSEDQDDYFARLREGSYDLVLSGWIADTEDPADFLRALVASDQIPAADRRRATTYNLSRWREPEMDRALSRYEISGDEADLVAIQARVAEHAPLLPLSYGPTIIAHAWRVQGFESGASVPRFSSLTLD